MRIAIVGCGLIGQKRAKTLGSCELVACADQMLEKAQHLASLHPGCTPYQHWRDIIARKDVDIVIVSTTHATLAEIGMAAVKAGKHILVEKPGGRRAHELAPIINEAKNRGVFTRVGFNHRYHRAFRKAFALVQENAIGELMFIRARYGHGGRIGYDQEWRAQPALSGGGELIDQGVHLIDLARCFLGEFTDVQGSAHTFYWNMPVDDNGFLLLKTAKQQVAHLHASCTEWKNTFSFEIYGRNGKLDINGLGGSYGVEKLTLYKMLPEMGPPETHAWEFPMQDDSWQFEFDEFIEDIKQQRQPKASLEDAHAALTIVETIYRMSNYDYR